MRLARLRPHPRDARVSFQEEGHLYTVQGLEGHPVSVTTLIHHFFSEFDADTVIGKMTRSRQRPDSPYYGMTNDQIKAQWERIRDAASQAGTVMHRLIEEFLNRPPEEAEPICTRFATTGVILEGTPATTEFFYFMRFWHDTITQSPLRAYRTEWLVYDAHKRLAGSIDLLLYDPVNDPEGQHLVIVDWKRSKKIKKKSDYSEHGRDFWGHLDHCNYNHYCLQLNIYRHLLETLYGKCVASMLLVVMHPSQSGYEVHEVPRMEREVCDVMLRLPMAFPAAAASNDLFID